MGIFYFASNLAYVDVALLPGLYALTTYELIIMYLDYLTELFVKLFGRKCMRVNIEYAIGAFI
jgi:hypothetical protein